MPFACVYIPDFPAEAIVRLEPELREQALAVVEGKAPLLKVVAVNERARQCGIEIGITQVQAQGYAPSIEMRKRAPSQEQAAHAALMDCACAMSPRIHGEAPDTVLLDMDGMDRLFGPPAKIARELARRVGELGMEANVGVASNVEAAIHAARGFAGITVISHGKEAERLAALSVEVLFDSREQRSQEMLEALERWGVRTFRALALLPEIALSQRLGEAGVRLRKLARGEGSRPLTPSEAPLDFEEAVELEDAIDLLEPLAFVLNRMLEQLCTRLATRSLAAQELRLRMELDPQEDICIEHSASGIRHSEKANPPQRRRDTEKIGALAHRLISASGETIHVDCNFELTLKFPVPMLDVKVFLKLLQLELRAKPPQAPVTKIWLRAEPARPRSTQGGLFLPEAPEPERLEVTLARIAGVVREPVRHGSTRRNADSQAHPAFGGRHSSEPDAPWPMPHAGKSEIANQKSQTELRVGSAEVLDIHRPDGFRMKRFAPQHAKQKAARRRAPWRNADFKSTSNQNAEIEQHSSFDIRHSEKLSQSNIPGGTLALRRFRPPIAAGVRTENGKPIRLDAGEEHAGKIVWVSGPWRASGEWWSNEHWVRDTWDLAVAGKSVTVYRIFREHEEWWIEGIYD